MLLSIILQSINHSYILIKAKLAERVEKRRKREAMEKYGWECQCPGCNGLMHTDDLVVAVGQTDYHWHYLCKCGHRSAWWLGAPCPIYDPDFQYDNKNPLFLSKRA